MAGIIGIDSIGGWLKKEFGEKVIKLAIDGGFTCPNRDGTLGTGGCAFCSSEGSGELASHLYGDAGDQSPGCAAGDAGDKSSGCTASDAAGQVSNDAADQAVNDAADQAVNDAADQAVNDSADQAVNDSADQAVNDAAGQAVSDALGRAIEEQIRIRKEKWPNARKFIAYFQSHTNTYAPAEKLRPMFEAALAQDGVIGIAIATRPDCLPPDVLDLLSELNEKTFMWVELGLQTIHEDTFGRGYGLETYDKAVRELSKRGIRTVTHLILGLPGETREQMTESVKYVSRPLDPAENATGSDHIFGLKLHLLNIVKGSRMEKTHYGYEPFSSIEDYVSFVCDLIEIIPPDITLHRLTGDVPRKLLISPEWSYKKRTILNGIAHELRVRGTHQGSRL